MGYRDVAKIIYLQVEVNRNAWEFVKMLELLKSFELFDKLVKAVYILLKILFKFLNELLEFFYLLLVKILNE